MRIQLENDIAAQKTMQLKLVGSWDFFTQEAFKVLRTNLQFCGQDVHVVSITSCHENEGKTTIALNLGKSLAELDKRVLVIDADMRKSVMVGRHSSEKHVTGLSEVLTGLAGVEESVYASQYRNLHIMFAGKYPPNPVELLSSPQFDALLAEMRSRYDYILLDMPPLGQVIDAAVVAPKCDGTMLVLDTGTVRYRHAQEVIAQLNMSGGKILGVVRNNVSRSKNKYYVGKYYGKSKYYGRNKYYGKKKEETTELEKDVFAKLKTSFLK